jgi:hypothetical protein
MHIFVLNAKAIVYAPPAAPSRRGGSDPSDIETIRRALEALPE